MDNWTGCWNGFLLRREAPGGPDGGPLRRHNGGVGLDIEQMLAWLCGLKHIRETIPFPRMMGKFYP
jgi:aspartyl-tRNA synthetase